MSTPQIYSIYKITNKINGKIYIGYTKNPKARLRGHKYSGKKASTKLQLAIRKYGFGMFSFEVIYQSKDKQHCLESMEQKFIEEYDSIKNGYNTRPGGGDYEDRKSSEEIKAKMRQSIKASWQNPKDPRKTEEHKQKVSETQKRLAKEFRESATKEQKEKKSKAQSDGIKAAWADPNSKFHGEEHKQRRGAATKKAWENEETRNKRSAGISAAWKDPNKKLSSPETRRKATEKRKITLADPTSYVNSPEHKKIIKDASSHLWVIMQDDDFVYVIKDLKEFCLNKGIRYNRMQETQKNKRFYRGFKCEKYQEMPDC